MLTVRPAFSFWHRGDAAILRAPHFRPNGPDAPYAHGLGPMVSFEEQDVFEPGAPLAPRFDDVETLVWTLPAGVDGAVRQLDRLVGTPPARFSLPFEGVHRRFVIQLAPDVERPAAEVQRAVVSAELLEHRLIPLAGDDPGALLPLHGHALLSSARLGLGDVVEVPSGYHRGAYVFVVDGAIEVGQPGNPVCTVHTGDAVTVRGPGAAWIEGTAEHSEVLVVGVPTFLVQQLRPRRPSARPAEEGRDAERSHE